MDDRRVQNPFSGGLIVDFRVGRLSGVWSFFSVGASLFGDPLRVALASGGDGDVAMVERLVRQVQ